MLPYYNVNTNEQSINGIIQLTDGHVVIENGDITNVNNMNVNTASASNFSLPNIPNAILGTDVNGNVIDATLNTIFWNDDGNNNIFNTNTGNVKICQSSGNVMIGSTATPLAKLHIVQDGTSDCFRVYDQSNDVTYFFIDSTGKVSINGAPLLYDLNVNTARFNSHAFFTSNYMAANQGMSWTASQLSVTANNTSPFFVRKTLNDATTNLLSTNTNATIPVFTVGTSTLNNTNQFYSGSTQIISAAENGNSFQITEPAGTMYQISTLTGNCFMRLGLSTKDMNLNVNGLIQAIKSSFVYDSIFQNYNWNGRNMTIRSPRSGSGFSDSDAPFQFFTNNSFVFVIDTIDVLLLDPSARIKMFRNTSIEYQASDAFLVRSTANTSSTNLFVCDTTNNNIIIGNASLSPTTQIYGTLKLSSGTANRALFLDSNNNIAYSTTTNLELSYLSGASSNIQQQINDIDQNPYWRIGTTSTPSPVIPSIYNDWNFGSYIGINKNDPVEALDISGNIRQSTLTINRALISDNNKNISSSSVTSTELGYLSGTTSNIQTQLNNLSSNNYWTLTGTNIYNNNTDYVMIGANNSLGTFKLQVTGPSIYKTTTNTTNAFNIQNSAGKSLLKIDTTNSKYYIGDVTNSLKTDLGVNGNCNGDTTTGQYTYDTSSQVATRHNDRPIWKIKVTTGSNGNSNGQFMLYLPASTWGSNNIDEPTISLCPVDNANDAIAYLDSVVYSFTNSRWECLIICKKRSDGSNLNKVIHVIVM